MSLLEAMDQVTVTCLERNIPLCHSVYKPLLFGLCDAAKQEESDSVMLSRIKRRLTDQLNERFKLKSLDVSSPIVLALIVLANALDPRFCKLSFLSNSK